MVNQISAGQEAVSLTIDVPRATLAKVQRNLDRLPADVKKSLSRNLVSALRGPAAKIVADFPSAPMSGMVPRWGGVKSSIRTNPASKNGRAIAVIGIAGETKNFNRLVAITERAGSRTPGLTPYGRVMTSTLQQRYPLVGKGGRFIWRSWLKHRPEAVGGALKILNDFVSQYNRRGR